MNGYRDGALAAGSETSAPQRAARLLAVLLLALMVAACASRAPERRVDSVDDRDEIVAIQSALLARGFSPGPVDGVVGPKTRDAISDYQRAYDLPVTGYIDQSLTSSLLGRTGALSSVDGSGLAEMRFLTPPYPQPLRGFLERRYGGQAARARPFGDSVWLDVSEANLDSAQGRDAALIVNAWSPDSRQTSELSIFRKAGGGYEEVLGPLPNQGFEFVDGFSNGWRDVAVSQGSGYRLWRFDGSRYR